MSKKYRYQRQNIKILIWDTAGQEKYKGLIPSYVRNSSIVFIVYDISNRASFENVQKWISFVRSIEKGMIVLCGNKVDLKREVEKKEVQELAKKEDIEFFECSAKYDFNIKKMFYNSIAELPIFNGSNRKTLVKELIKENEEIYDENEQAKFI